jgi:hypothetical protein
MLDKKGGKKMGHTMKQTKEETNQSKALPM